MDSQRLAELLKQAQTSLFENGQPGSELRLQPMIESVLENTAIARDLLRLAEGLRATQAAIPGVNPNAQAPSVRAGTA
jgi:hypothetical protein